MERNPTGQWRGFILQEDLTTRMGYFPSTHVQLNSNSELRDVIFFEYDFCYCCMNACLYVYCQGLSTFRKTHLSPVNTNTNNRLLTASTSINSNNVVLRHHRPSCVFSQSIFLSIIY